MDNADLPYNNDIRHGSAVGPDSTVNRLFSIGLALNHALRLAEGRERAHLEQAIQGVDGVIGDIQRMTLPTSATSRTSRRRGGRAG